LNASSTKISYIYGGHINITQVEGIKGLQQVMAEIKIEGEQQHEKVEY